MTIGSRMNGGNSETGRVENDLYETTPECVHSLLSEVTISKEATIWEPACGNGALSEVLINDYGYEVVSEDLIEREYGQGGVDFLQSESLKGDVIITNPPFEYAEEFIRKAYELSPVAFAFILPMNYWNASSRLRLWDDCRPAVIYPMTWRPDFRNLGRPTMNCMWCLWTRNHPRETHPSIIPMRKVTQPVDNEN